MSPAKWWNDRRGLSTNHFFYSPDYPDFWQIRHLVTEISDASNNSKNIRRNSIITCGTFHATPIRQFNLHISTTPPYQQPYHTFPKLPVQNANRCRAFWKKPQDPWLDPSTVELTLQMHSTAEEQLRLEESWPSFHRWKREVKIGIPVEQWQQKPVRWLFKV